MKVRDSGMPDEEMWGSFFDPSKILATLGIDGSIHDLVEFGCGYGTFTTAAARIVSGTVYALDIEPEMVETVERKCRETDTYHVRAVRCDFVANGTGLSDCSVDATLLFNILHHDNPVNLMREALRILKPKGILAVIHWNYDPTTPRGPAMDIRPRPEDCIAWGKEAGFRFDGDRYDLPPYHYGLVFKHPSA